MKKENKEGADELRREFQQISRLVVGLVVLVFFSITFCIYLILDPNLSAFDSLRSSVDSGAKESRTLDVSDEIVNGIHVETGFIDAPGMMVTIQNCTNCHSSQLVIANRMNEDRWIQTIRWMQETQNLWDLGENEKVILDYLVTNYPPRKVGRRAGLTNIEWYELE